MVRLGPIVFACCCLVANAVFGQSSPEIRVVKDANQKPIAVETTGWTKDELEKFAKPDESALEYLRSKLSIFVLDDNQRVQRPAIGGIYSVAGDAVRLTPQYPLRSGMSYQAEYYPPARRSVDSPARYEVKIHLPAPPPAPPTSVTAIYPSASVLPENQLRFYVHFSAPMAAGNAYEHVTLYKANGDIVKRAFLEIGEELWDGTGTRITLLFDPGRVKKGLSPRFMFGPVLETGQDYRLVIEKTWRDANNQQLTANFEKKFTAGPAVETAVDIKQWKVEPPAASDKSNPLTVQFPRSLDRALLLRMLTVVDAKGQEVEGDITLADDERRWEFRPKQAMSAGNYSLVIDTALEDSAGNNVARPFEIDIFEQVDKTPGPEFVKLPFTIR